MMLSESHGSVAQGTQNTSRISKELTFTGASTNKS